jgi:hypothetical protein
MSGRLAVAAVVGLMLLARCPKVAIGDRLTRLRRTAQALGTDGTRAVTYLVASPRRE